MIDQVNITSSSYIINNRACWKLLKKKINFNFVNNLNGGFLNSDNKNLLVTVIFVPDLYDINLSYNTSKINSISSSIIYLVKKKLSESSKPLIFAISKWSPENPIRIALEDGIAEKIYSKLIKELKKLQKIKKNLIIVNLDNEFGKYGFLKCFDDRNWYIANSRLSILGIEVLVETLNKIIERLEKAPSKVLILDCDNTLWGGVVGEDGISSIKLGQDGVGKAFHDFQKVIKNLMKQGIMLAISSKNNLKDVLEVFNKHKSMVLKKNDILIYKVNWNEKHLNIKKISEELNLSLDSFVFWDDNPLERDKVKIHLPKVFVVDPPEDISKWPKTLIELNKLAKFKVTKEDKKKLKQYKIKRLFDENLKGNKNTVKYLKSIKLKPSIQKIDKSTFERAHQIIMKTNQFNLRTQRFDKGELENFVKLKKNISFLVSLKDNYGDHGIVGLVMASKTDSKTIFLVNFIMSCRILGRNLETWIFKQLKNLCRKKGISLINAEYIKTEKNDLVLNLLENHGFKKENISNKTRKMFSTEISKLKLPDIEIYGG